LEQFFDSNFLSSPAGAASPGKPGVSAVESLGTQMIAGLETIGTRETNLIETATIGNEAPVLEKREFWYSPRLGVNLITERQEPRFATQQNFEVTNIALGEPDAKLFDPPSGFRILDVRRPPEIPSSAPSSQD
jgi:hypothetical protein